MELSDWITANGTQSQLRTSNDHLVIDYLDWLKHTRGRSPQTLRSYGSTLEAWLGALGLQPVLDATREDMEGFMQRKRVRRGAGRMGSPATRKREASCLRAFYQWCE